MRIEGGAEAVDEGHRAEARRGAGTGAVRTQALLHQSQEQAQGGALEIGIALQKVAQALGFAVNAKPIADLAMQHGLPSAGIVEFAEAGGMIGEDANRLEGHRRAATYVDKILKGANAGDLPIEQATKFELVINLKTATALGLTIPRSLLVRADEVIQ